MATRGSSDFRAVFWPDFWVMFFVALSNFRLHYIDGAVYSSRTKQRSCSCAGICVVVTCIIIVLACVYTHVRVLFMVWFGGASLKRVFAENNTKESANVDRMNQKRQYTVHSTQYTYMVRGTQYSVHSTQCTVYSTQFTLPSTQ